MSNPQRPATTPYHQKTAKKYENSQQGELYVGWVGRRRVGGGGGVADPRWVGVLRALEGGWSWSGRPVGIVDLVNGESRGGRIAIMGGCGRAIMGGPECSSGR